MSDKKCYFVLSPYECQDETLIKAANYYGSKDYQDVSTSPEFIDELKKVLSDPTREFNVQLMLIGSSLIGIALSDSVYVSKDWETSDYCKICHALAFSHGLDIVYES